MRLIRAGKLKHHCAQGRRAAQKGRAIKIWLAQPYFVSKMSYIVKVEKTLMPGPLARAVPCQQNGPQNVLCKYAGSLSGAEPRKPWLHPQIQAPMLMSLKCGTCQARQIQEVGHRVGPPAECYGGSRVQPGGRVLTEHGWVPEFCLQQLKQNRQKYTRNLGDQDKWYFSLGAKLKC